MCGCDFDDKLDKCRNKYPDCPALTGTYVLSAKCQFYQSCKRGCADEEMMELVIVNYLIETRRELSVS